MTRDEVIKGLERLSERVRDLPEFCAECGTERAAFDADVPRAALALLSPPTTEQIEKARRAMSQWFLRSDERGRYSHVFDHALDALAREPGLLEKIEHQEEQIQRQSAGIRSLCMELGDPMALRRPNLPVPVAASRIAALEAKLARVREVLIAFDAVDPTHMQHGVAYWMMRLRAALDDGTRTIHTPDGLPVECCKHGLRRALKKAGKRLEQPQKRLRVHRPSGYDPSGFDPH